METYLQSVNKRFTYYKTVAERTFDQLNDEQLFWQYNEESNNIAIIVQHLAGNMFSRWTDFLTTDGEKDWRARDTEFEPVIKTREELLRKWNEGWACMFTTLDALTDDDLQNEIFIRGEKLTVVDAINRQLAHYPYHIGQIVFIGKMVAGDKWETLTVPKGQSESYNAAKFGKPGN